jgi:hypothetical protein
MSDELLDRLSKATKKIDLETAAGLSYTYLLGESVGDEWRVQCDSCGEIADVEAEPFPHKEGCLLVIYELFYEQAKTDLEKEN